LFSFLVDAQFLAVDLQGRYREVHSGY
jgi:hypothetical protein